MKTPDARSLSREVQQHNRNQAIRLFCKGKTRREIADIVGVHYGVVCRWIRKYQAEGEDGIVLQKRGRRSGEQRILTEAQEKKLKKLLMDKNPKQLKLPFALWNRKAIQSAIYRMWRARIAIRTIGDYMKRWGFTPQKPLKRAYEKNPKAVQKWLDEEYPKIKLRAQEEKAEIFWGDATGVKRFSVNMISAITNRGLLRFMLYDQTMDARLFIKFLHRLIGDADRKVFLILDNLRVHHAKLVRRWLEKHKDRIEVFYLPAYLPEHRGGPRNLSKPLSGKSLE